MTAKWKMSSILYLFYIACPTKITLSLETNRSEVYFSEKSEFQISKIPTEIELKRILLGENCSVVPADVTGSSITWAFLVQNSLDLAYFDNSGTPK